MWFIVGAFAQSYNTTELSIQIPKRTVAEWSSSMAPYARRKSMTWLFRDSESGLDTAVRDREGGVKSLGRPELVASWMAVRGYLEPGYEYDLVLGSGDGTGMRPVSIWVESKQKIIVGAGSSIALPEAGPDMSTVVQTTGLRGYVEEGAAQFEPRLRTVVLDAFSRLSEEERQALSAVQLVRRPGKGPGTRGKWRNAALFEPGEPSSIVIYDDLFFASGLFVGDVDAPFHPATRVLLHEIAHALEHEKTVAARDAFNARVDAFNALPATERTQEGVDALDAKRKALRSMPPTSDGFRKRFADITDYGATSDAEAFAEAYSLYRIDPEALERISPEAYDWLETRPQLLAD